MTVEHLVKRTIYVAQCACGERTEVADNPPRERQCKCGAMSAVWYRHDAHGRVGVSVSREDNS